MKIYIAAPIANISAVWHNKIINVISKIQQIKQNVEIYNPREHGVPNAWGMDHNEWMRSIFTLDCVAIDNSDWMVVCDFGREATSGTSWEAGYAFGKGKSILVIRMDSDCNNYSVMINGCSTNHITYNDFINTDFDLNFYDVFCERGRKQKQIYN